MILIYKSLTMIDKIDK